MTDTEVVRFTCAEIEQPLGTFYVGVIGASDLVSISWADVRRISERDVEQHIGIQRPLVSARVREISQYVTTVDAAFPTAVILAVNSDDVEYDSEQGIMEIRRDECVAKIIDGQHRIAGLEKFSGAMFQSIVTIFVDMDIEEQANIFATINLKQTKVNRSLAYDLFEFAKTRSPQKTAHNISRLLNFQEASPLYGRIKLLGVATPGERRGTLTQALVVDRLLDLITDDPMRDRDELKRGHSLETLPDTEWQRLPFRNLFIRDKDAVIARNVWNFFAGVSARWPGVWGPVERGFILNRTTGFSALMRFLGVLYPRLSAGQEIVEAGDYSRVLRRVEISEEEFHRDVFVPGSSGINALYRRLTPALP